MSSSSSAGVRISGKMEQQRGDRSSPNKARNIGGAATYEFGGTSIIHEDGKQEGNLPHADFFDSFVDDFDMSDVRTSRNS